LYDLTVEKTEIFSTHKKIPSTKWDFFSGIIFFDILNCNTYKLRLSFEEYNRNIFICIVYSVLVIEVACG
jgi:hypothetical protein